VNFTPNVIVSFSVLTFFLTVTFVSGFCTAVPDPPVNVFVRCNSKNRSAEIWWQPGKENYAPILNFIVQYNTSFQPDLWYDIATNISQNNRRIVVSMSPWGNYTFRVISRNKIGLSLPSMRSFNVCTTDPGVPDKNPENVIGEGDQPGNLVIFWTVRSFSFEFLLILLVNQFHMKFCCLETMLNITDCKCICLMV
jgi:hypothetical protein